MASAFSVLGKRLPREDAIEKVTGEAKQVSDMQLPGMLHARFLRSPHAHAKIVKIDTGKAESLPGVKAVLTHQNVPKVHSRGKFEFLLDETVHCVGEEVVAVAAVTKEIAEEALKLIEVEYKLLPAVFTAEEAMRPGAPLVHSEHGSNIFHGTAEHPAPRRSQDGWIIVEDGDVEKGFAEADCIVEDIYETPIQYPCSPMPRVVVCQWTGNKLTCWCDTQAPLRVWQDLAKCLGMPQSHVRLVVDHCIGGYGAKEPGKTAVLTALLARKAGRPVKTQFSREEDFVGTHRRLNYKTCGKMGVKKDGTITAVQNRVITNFGADSQVPLEVLGTSATNAFSVLYNWQSSKFEGCSVMTNTTHHAAVLGFGDPEAILCVERLIDEAAEKIGMDPAEFRLKNCARYGSKGSYRAKLLETTGPLPWGIMGPDMDSFPECIRKVAEKAHWNEKWKGWGTPVEVNGARRRGIGIALGMHHTMFTDYAAVIKMNQDGTANVLSGSVEIGQGCGTAMTQVVAEALGLHYEDVRVILADSAVTPAGLGNIGSCGTTSAIGAAKRAADDTRQKLFEVAAGELGTKPDNLEAKDRRIYIKEQPEKGIPIADVCRIGYQIVGSGKLPPLDTIRDDKTGKAVYPFAIAAAIVEVEVDTETGELTVDRITVAGDCGRAINPTIVENQIDLGITMGNSWIRTENFVIDEKTGAVLNPNLLDYRIMTIMDMPKGDDMQEIIVEMPCAWGPYGAKGFSETPMSAVGPAIANAIYNAIGARIRGEHCSPEKILEALGK
ncbi:xanthine dehydrogenase family protein molybdopterin-binding subunit [Chloroflexota bacterium]